MNVVLLTLCTIGLLLNYIIADNFFKGAHLTTDFFVDRSINLRVHLSQIKDYTFFKTLKQNITYCILMYFLLNYKISLNKKIQVKH